MENSCLNNVLCLFCILNEKKGQKRADFDMEVCNFLCFGSAIRSLCQKLFLWENMCTSNCALPMSQNCFLFGFRLYIHSNIIALISEYHLDSRNSLFTEINQCRVGQKRHISGVICRLCQKHFFFEKMYTLSCAPLSALKLHFYLVSGHICI